MSQMRSSIQKAITKKGMRVFVNPEGFMPSPMNMLRALMVKCLAQKQRMF
jgi:predicted metal-dependent peptidase